MVGYIFIAENKVNGKKFIGKKYSVSFDRKYFGDNPGLISDLETQSSNDFTVRMIRACETVKECDFIYDYILKENNALSDPSFYNCSDAVEDAPKKKRSRKKAVEE